ncbi:cell wall-active antibiotics response protein LiaF [Ectobacillus ponti]|uniref:Cell wall-active antibiotics response protein LiaF n=1 Tax=Ectobacillus ponti TaxID=2961894 RepID=A0AA42BQP8_9BACI|nr:cell wall-active antibiotics response protein LiaF [Ectobacillus ponti]MCP8968679.1 cell wall-active antibiotics response protein LiaF [Ectobacillus ponti]
MKRSLSHTEIVSAGLVILGIGVLADLITGRFSPPALLFAAALLLLGRHYRRRRKMARGNMLLLIGMLTLAGQLFSSVAFQLLLAAVLLYGGVELLRSRRRPLSISLQPASPAGSRLVRKQPFLRNFLIGTHRVMDRIYELQDWNIRYGIGDVEVDLSTAMIPEGETVLVIHGVIGNIRLHVPYDVELSLHHSVLIGKTVMLGEEDRSWNQTLSWMTEGYAAAPRRVKIVTSLFIGDTEVRYV